MVADSPDFDEFWEDPDAAAARVAIQNRERGEVVTRRWGMAAAAILVVHGQMLLLMAQSLWKRSHYQAFPIIIAGFAWLVSMRLPLIQWPEETDFSVRKLLLFGVGASFFVVAVVLVSPWIGLISCLATLWASVWYFGGRSAAEEMRGPFCFLALLIPLPLGLDMNLIVSLQRWATEFASQGLEFMSVYHTTSGVSIRTATKSYLVEEACSGIHSLFTAFYAAMFYCVYFRYSALRSFLLLMMTVVWVVSANALRVFLLVYCDAEFELSLDSGWRHEALGLLTYATAIMLTLSTDQFFQFLFPVMSEGLIDVQVEFNQQIRRPVQDFLFGLLDQPRVVGRASVMIPVVLFAIVYVGGNGIAAAQAFFSTGDKASPSLPPTQWQIDLQQQITKDSLPAEINGWKLSGFDEITRAADDPFGGLKSSQWHYHGHGLNVIVSLDGYYDAWHRLAVCYTGMGWVVDSADNRTTVQRLPGGEEAAVWHTEYRMYRDLSTRSMVLFSCFDSRLNPVAPPPVDESARGALQDRLRAAFRRETAPEVSIVPPVFQVQLLAQTDREILSHESEALLNMFKQVRSQLLNSAAGVQK